MRLFRVLARLHPRENHIARNVLRGTPIVGISSTIARAKSAVTVRHCLSVDLIGRKAVLEAVRSERVHVVRVLISGSARGEAIDELRDACAQAGIPIDQASEKRLDALAGGDRMHQGVAATIDLPPAQTLDDFLQTRSRRDWSTNLLILDHVHNPANVGMILRTAAAAGIDGVVLPRLGTAGLGPLTVKAGSGMVFAVPVLEVESIEAAISALQEAAFSLLGMDAGGASLFEAELPERTAFVLGNETAGLSPAAVAALDEVVSIPLAAGVESLNVAAAAAVLCFELVRRRAD